MEGRRQAGFAHHISLALARLGGQKCCGGGGGSPDALGRNLQARVVQARGQISRSGHRVIRQHHELDVIVIERLDELISAGHHLALFDEDAVHIG